MPEPTGTAAKPRSPEAVSQGIERARKALMGGDEAVAAHLLSTRCESVNGCWCELEAGHEGDHRCRHGWWL